MEDLNSDYRCQRLSSCWTWGDNGRYGERVQGHCAQRTPADGICPSMSTLVLLLSPRGLAHLSSPAGHACSPSLVPGLHFCIYCCVSCVCIYSWTSVVVCSPRLRIRCRIGWRSEIRIPGPTKAASSYSLPTPLGTWPVPRPP